MAPVTVTSLGESMRKFSISVGLAALVAAATASSAAASNSWSGYHWPRSANPFTIALGDNLTAVWKSYYSTTAADWSQSTGGNPLRVATVAGATTGRKCRPTAGRVEVCDAAYGKNGWLGLAQVWASGGHITQATAKMNDTYIAPGTKYDSPYWRGSVMCQEVGHAWGLDHQDTSGADLHTCMDYASAPAADNTKPNAHDYDQQAIDYSHLDATARSAPSRPGNGPYAVERRDSRRSTTIVERYSDGSTVTTYITWAA